MEIGFHPAMSDDEYFGALRLSYSGAKLLERSPAHFHFARANPPSETPALRLGKAAHLAMLQPELFADAYRQAPEGIDRRTTKGKDAYAAFLAEAGGRLVLSAPEWATVTGMASGFRAHPLAPRLFEGAAIELAMSWEDAATGCPCKGKMDGARLADGVILDVKTTPDASPHAFVRSVVNYSYGLQMAAYLDGAKTLGADVTDFLIVATEKVPPFACSVFRLPDAAWALGRTRWAAACERFAACLETDRWPGYEEGITELALPVWALRELYESDDNIDTTEN